MSAVEQHRSLKVLIAGGGTGGHVYPALAIIEALRGLHQIEVLYVGGKGGIETRIVPGHGLQLVTIWISGIVRGLSLKNLLFPIKLLSSLWNSFRIIGRFRPDVAVGTGGYVSGPPLYVAKLRKVPVLIQEQDVFPGITTRLLARYADRICIPYAAAAEHFTGADRQIAVTGNPVRQGLRSFKRNVALKNLGLDAGKTTVFVFGGSQGARSINTAIGQLADWLTEEKKCQILWQTGEKLFDEVAEFVDNKNSIVVKAYIEQMGEAYAAADIVVCRAGAGSLSELAIVAKPAVLIPYPYAAGNHQEKNSRLIEAEGAAKMIAEKDNWHQELRAALEKLIDDPQLRLQQQENWQKLARENAAEEIAKEIIHLATQKRQ